MRYELFYLIGASREADAEKIKGDIMKMVTEAGGEFSEKETIEKRRMAYQIKHETHGIYIAQRFELDAEKMTELSKKINLYPNLIRFIISRADELPELKSKEERISESATKPLTAKEPEKKVETPTVKKEEVKDEVEKEKKEDKTASDDDIDKKLEEILNI